MLAACPLMANRANMLRGPRLLRVKGKAKACGAIEVQTFCAGLADTAALEDHKAIFVGLVEKFGKREVTVVAVTALGKSLTTLGAFCDLFLKTVLVPKLVCEEDRDLPDSASAITTGHLCLLESPWDIKEVCSALIANWLFFLSSYHEPCYGLVLLAASALHKNPLPRWKLLQ